MVYESRKYKNPPVVEALCEILFVDSKWDSALPGQFYDKIKADYPKKKELQQVGVEVSISKDIPASRVRCGDTRLQFFKEDGSQLIQIEKNLLVVNQLRPYPKFEEWKPVVDRMLANYLEIAKPKGIKQIGTRYIDKIVIPVPSFKMEDYFCLYPHLPESLNLVHGRFLMRLEIPAKHKGHNLIITFGTSMADSPGTSAELLDIYDIYASAEFLSGGDIDKFIEEAHENIITAFENSITEKTRELFG
jgi:uncharacterized protein (TIGR04255 family)